MAKSDLVPYLVQEGEFWSSVAYKAYGDEGETAIIMAANPRVPITGRLPRGLTLYVPIVSANDNLVIPTELLPPWQQ